MIRISICILIICSTGSCYSQRNESGFSVSNTGAGFSGPCNTTLSSGAVQLPDFFQSGILGLFAPGFLKAERAGGHSLSAQSWWDLWTFRISLLALFGGLLLLIFFYRYRFFKVQKKLLEDKVVERTAELSELNSLLEEKQEEITLQNEELDQHRHHLEQKIAERTEELEQAMRRAGEADKLKAAFLANMSHEIRTPMNAIMGFAALMQTAEGDQEREEFSEIIVNNCNTLMVLLNDILEVSQIEANQIEIQKERFSAHKVFRELESYFTANTKKDIQIRYVADNAGRELIIRNDITRFRQVFNNLISNACKYTDRGSVEFGYQKRNGTVEFFVRDTGIGIAEAEYQNIFNFFHKINKGENQYYRGAGIGLSISNKLVELMGGRISLESELDVGTTFYVTLDGEDLHFVDSVNEKPERKTLKRPPDFSGKTIIVAEDEPANFQLIEKVLKNTGARILWAKNGREAVEQVRELTGYEHCLVIMDLKMPVMNGMRAAEAIREISTQIPVIAVTAYAQSRNRDEILRQNFVEYISKPFNPDELMDTLIRFLCAN
ncbi:MAG: response regulator [Bacteroidales bacterium]|nr:response regulator [Bacteroidales bacterium]